jgi:hypothetical protein
MRMYDAQSSPLVASAQMNKIYQPSEALDPTPRLSIKWAASEVGADQGPTVSEHGPNHIPRMTRSVHPKRLG